MKRIFYTLSVIFVAAFAITFSSCSKESGDEPGVNKSIIGSWRLESSEMTKANTVMAPIYSQLDIAKDGTCSLYTSSQSVENAKWSVTGAVFTIKFVTGTMAYNFRIGEDGKLTLTSSATVTEEDSEDPVNVQIVAVYTRIKD